MEICPSCMGLGTDKKHNYVATCGVCHGTGQIEAPAGPPRTTQQLKRHLNTVSKREREE